MSKWSIVRLELGRTEEFPDGSASRAYMLRVPLDAAGLIDEYALARRAGMATVRRFWPNEPDETGRLIRNRMGWLFSYEIDDEDGEKLYHLEAHPLRVGDHVTITEPDGTRLPFRVVRSHPDGVSAA